MPEVIRIDTVVPADKNANYANAYSDAAGTKKIGQVWKNQYVQVYADEGRCSKIKYSTYSAYVARTDLVQGERQTNSNVELTGQTLTQNNFSNDFDVSGYDREYYKKLQWKFVRSLGVPPKFNLDVDVQYTNEISPGIGRVYNRTFLSNPSILSICPGSVDFLPGFSKSEKNNLFDLIADAASGAGENTLNKLQEDQKNLSGKLYSFQSAYTTYGKILNVLCRAAAILLGIGDELMPNTSIPLKQFDYGYWTLRETDKVVERDPSIFKDFWTGAIQTATSAVSDSNYVHFFLTNSETSVVESASTGTEESMIGQVLDSSGLSSLAKNINFMFGGAVGDPAADTALKDLMNDSEIFGGTDFLSKIGRAATNYVKGGRMVIPLMLGDVSYEKAIDCSLTFMSPYGDKKSVFMYCMVPALHLLAFALPKQISDNMYTYPFIVRVYQQGWFNTDLAVISNIRLQRGGQDDTSWTEDGLATEWTVQFSVVPLYSELMVTSSDNPLLFMQNDGLLEYLGNLCGVDLKANNLGVKAELAVDMMLSRLRDIPTNFGRTTGEWAANKIRTLFQFQNG